MGNVMISVDAANLIDAIEQSSHPEDVIATVIKYENTFRSLLARMIEIEELLDRVTEPI
jgi:hypothetical protein